MTETTRKLQEDLACDLAKPGNHAPEVGDLCIQCRHDRVTGQTGKREDVPGSKFSMNHPGLVNQAPGSRNTSGESWMAHP
jgi:hypothetical protein